MAVQQKLTQHCKSTILQLKKNKEERKKIQPFCPPGVETGALRTGYLSKVRKSQRAGHELKSPWLLRS